MRLPENFEKKMRDLLKEDFDDYIACYEEPRYYGLRVNTNKISVEEFKKICPFEIEPIPWIENGFYYDGEHLHFQTWKIVPDKICSESYCILQWDYFQASF